MLHRSNKSEFGPNGVLKGHGSRLEVWMAEASQGTGARHEQPPTDPRAEQVRVVLLAGSGSDADDDLYRLVHRRLLLLTTILAFILFLNICVVVVAMAILSRRPNLPQSPVEY